MTDIPQPAPDAPEPEPETEPGNTPPDLLTGPKSQLPVRIPTALLTRIDQECQERGIVRSELVTNILTTYYQKPGAAPDASVLLVLESQKQHIEQLTQENAELKNKVFDLETVTKISNSLNESGFETRIVPTNEYTAELEQDLLNAVKIACNSILPTRSDFRKRTKHYGRLEADRG